MKVKELIGKLEQMDSDLELLFFAEDEEIAPPGYAFRVLDIIDVTECEARAKRVEQGIVSLSFGKEQLSNMWACIELTSDM